MLYGGERGRDSGDRCVSGCFGGSGIKLVNCLVSGDCFGLLLPYLGDVPARGCEELGAETYDCFMNFECFALAGYC